MPSPVSPASPGSTTPAAPSPWPMPWRFLVGGVVLPAVTWTVEMTTHMCAGAMFDPLRTPAHVVLVALVPSVMLWVFVTSRKNRQPGRAMQLLVGATTGVAGVYALLFLPILPVALYAVIMGLGLLPLSPLLALLAGIRATRWFRRLGLPLGPWGLGLGVGLMAMLGADAPRVWTSVGLKRAASEDATRHRDGVGMLRAWADRDFLVRKAYIRAGNSTDIVSMVLGLDSGISHLDVRRVYWQVFGEPFNAAPPPRGINESRFADEGWEWDADVGGTDVAGRVRNLSLASSRMDATVDADALLAYTEWTLEFRSRALSQLEARAEVQLPPGAVVSSATLWVDGRPREATMASKSLARRAYESVVQRRRDPLLVTDAGPDRVLVQCFPVPPGGTMKIRLGITTPLAADEPATARLRLPRFSQHNFSIPDDVGHSIWVESRRDLVASAGLSAETRGEGIRALRGTVMDNRLPSTVIIARRDPAVTEAWTMDPVDADQRVLARFEERAGRAPTGVFLVVDGSRLVGGAAGAIADSLADIPEGVPVTVLLASDDIVTLLPRTRWDHDVRARVQAALRSARFAGGQENVPALARAYDDAARDNAVIAWIHGPQQLWGSLAALEQLAERGGDVPLVINVPVVAGPDPITPGLSEHGPVRVLPIDGDVRAALGHLFRSWNPETRSVEAVFDVATTDGSGKRTSDHLARLWAAHEVQRLLESPLKDREARAVKLAAAYHLVTRVTGAVALETEKDERAAGLEPGDPAVVPSVPEPGLVALAMLVVVAAMLVVARRRWQAPA